MESKSEERDKIWLEERVEEVDREMEECSDKAQTNIDEITRIERRLERLKPFRKEKEGNILSQSNYL